MGARLRVDPIACAGHGNCHELLPEIVGIDRWGYPVLDEREVDPSLEPDARRAVRLCPKLALRLERSGRG